MPESSPLTSRAPVTDKHLLERAREGDPDAIRGLYDRHAARVFTVTRRIVADADAAADCAQEAWVRAIQALPSFRGDARFSTWLHRIAVNTALQAMRREETEAAVRGAWEAAPSTPSQRGDTLLARRLEEALLRLPRGMRAVLVLHDVEGYTHEEISELLNCSVGTSKSQLFKARTKMREMLAGVRTPGTQEGAKT